MEDFSIALGLQLKNGEFEKIQKDINKLSENPIVLKIDDSQIETRIKNIRNQLENLNDCKINVVVNSNINSSNITKQVDNIVKNTNQTVQKIKPVEIKLINSSVRKDFEEEINGIIQDEQKLFEVTRNYFGKFGEVTTKPFRNAKSEITGFTVEVKNVNQEIESLKYNLANIENSKGKVIGQSYQYSGSTGSDNYARQLETDRKQTERNTAAVTNYTSKLKILKDEYLNTNASKPIQNSKNIEHLNSLYDEAIAKVNTLGTATKESFASSEASVKAAIAEIRSQVKIYREVESMANQLRAKPIETIKGEQIQLLREFEAKIKSSGIALEQLKSYSISDLSVKLGRVTDRQSLTEYLNMLVVAKAEFKALQAEQKNYSQIQKASADKEKATLKEVENEYQNLISLVGQIGKKRISLFGLDSESEKDIPKITRIKEELRDLYTQYAKAKMTFTTNFPTYNLDELKVKWQEILRSIELAKNETIGNIAYKTEQEKVNSAYKETLSLIQQIKNIQTNLLNLDKEKDSNQILELEAQLKRLQTTYQATRQSFDSKFSTEQTAEINSALQTTIDKMATVQAKINDVKKSDFNSIKGNIVNGTLENQIAIIENNYRRLGKTEDEINLKTQELRSLLGSMKASGDDIEKVTGDYTQFGKTLVTLQNEIKTLRIEQQKLKDEANLANKKTALTLQIDSMFKKYSAAIPRFGTRLQQIKNEIESADGIKLTNLQREVKELKSQIESAGKATMTLGDKLKSKLGSLATYFSASMMISYAINGVKSMFDNVLKVDTAMTELYRVTDLTDKQYSQLYDNMAAGAKKYGVALNDIIESTASWVRLGFEANTASQLAEVTAMYQHVTDLDNDTAVKNLVTAYKGYQEELLQVSDGDSTKAVTKIADAYDKLGGILPMKNYIG